MQNLRQALVKLLQHNRQSTDTPSPQQEQRVKTLIDCLNKTLDSELDCAEFDRDMDCLAEILSEGSSTDDVLTPEFKAHLIHSNSCSEEFEALKAILEAEQKGELENILPE